MATATAYEQEVAEDSQVKEGQDFRPDLSDPRQQSAAWFREAVGVYEVQKEAAGHISVDPGYLNHMLTGKKPVNLTHVELIRRARPKAFQRLVEAMALDGSMLVVPRSEIELAPGQAAMLRASKDLLGGMWPAYRDRLAAKVFRCTGDMIEVALELDAKITK